MKTLKICTTLAILTAFLLNEASAMPLPSAARSVVPTDLQQLFSVDYRELRDSPTAMQLKAQLLPDNLKEFEDALRGVGINPEKDVDSVSIAAFRTQKQGVKQIGIAAGPFAMKTVLKKLATRGIKPKKYRMTDTYPMEGGFVMCFLDGSTLLFGEMSSVKLALDTRDGEILNLDANSTMSDMMSDVDAAAVWSILDQAGTQNVMRSALGDASKIADFDSIKKRLVGSSYTMSFASGVNFDLTVLTSDTTSAAQLSSLVKAGLIYKKMNASAPEKVALDNSTVDADGANFKYHFKASDQQFQSLMHSQLFAAVSH